MSWNSNEVTRDANTLAGVMTGLVFSRSKASSGEFIAVVGIIGLLGYSINEYVIKPTMFAGAYLGKLFGADIPVGVSYPPLPAFLILLIAVFIASRFVWLLSYFKENPNYASRAIIGFSIGMYAIVKVFESKFDNASIFSVFGPLTLGHNNRHLLIALIVMVCFSVLGWLYFAYYRFTRFKPINEKEKSSYSGTQRQFVARQKNAITSFLNRRLNFGLVCFLTLVAIADPNFWPGVESYGNSDTSLNVILRTIATYLFIAYFIITLQLRSARKLQTLVCYGGYIPPYYVYSLAIIGVYCAAIFAFIPYEYMGRNDFVLQAIPPLIYFSVSLIRTGWQYYKLLNYVDFKGMGAGREFTPRMTSAYFLLFVTFFSMSLGSVHYVLSKGIHAQFDNEAITDMINDQLPRKRSDQNNKASYEFLEVIEIKVLPNNPDLSQNTSAIAGFEMTLNMKARLGDGRDAGYKYMGEVEAPVKIKGNVLWRKYKDSFSLDILEIVNIDPRIIEKSEKVRWPKYGRRQLLLKSIRRAFHTINPVNIPGLVFSFVYGAEVVEEKLVVEFR